MFFNQNIANCKLLVFDLDGTILDKNSKISNKMIDICSKLKKQNILFTIATGRSTKPALDYAKILGVNIPIICLGGSLIIDPINKEIIRETKIDNYVSKNLIKILDQKKYEVALYYGETLYIKKLSEWSRGYINRQNIPYVLDKDFSKNLKENPTMILMVGNSGDIDKLEIKLHELVENSLSIVRSLPHFCEISNINGTKFFALEFLLKKLKIKFSDVITFGNGNADIEIIKNSGIGISIDNSPKALLENSDMSIDSPDNHGVEKFLEKFLLNS